MMTINELLVNQRVKYSELPFSIRDNINELLYKSSIIRYHYNDIMVVNSGYRTEKYNMKIGGAKNSFHTKGLAIDISDKSHKLYNWLTRNTSGLELVKSLDLYLEDASYTVTWCHIQLRAPKSGKRVFIP
jgi:hypothetical protein